MTQFVKTYRICTQCGGTGQQYSGGGENEIGPFPCTWPGCVDGVNDGYIEIGITALEPGLDDISDRLDDVLDKCNDIKEVVDEL